ncbi:MAG: RNA polymerase sigma factor [Bacillota bacterium]
MLQGDAELVYRILSGDDVEGAAEVIDRLNRELFRYTYRHVAGVSGANPCVHDVEDLVHMTIQIGLQRIRVFEPGRASVVSWLKGIARNLVLKYAERERKRPIPGGIAEAVEAYGTGAEGIYRRTLAALADGDADVVPGEGPGTDSGLIKGLLAELSPGYREIVCLVYLEERPVAEVAALLGISRNNAAVRLSRARAACRRALTGLQVPGGRPLNMGKAPGTGAARDAAAGNRYLVEEKGSDKKTKSNLRNKW